MKVYRHKWFIPLVIAFILLGAWFTRWETEATKQETSKSGQPYVLKWEKDRWSGTVWSDMYAVNLHARKAVSGSSSDTDFATGTWAWAVIIDGIWLLWAYRKDRKEAMALDNKGGPCI